MSESILNDDEEVVFNASYETRIFPNANGSITIKQILWPDDDVMVVIPIEQVNRVCRALRNAKRDLQG